MLKNAKHVSKVDDVAGDLTLEFQPPCITNIASQNYSEELANRTHIPIKSPE